MADEPPVSDLSEALIFSQSSAEMPSFASSGGTPGSGPGLREGFGGIGSGRAGLLLAGLARWPLARCLALHGAQRAIGGLGERIGGGLRLAGGVRLLIGIGGLGCRLEGLGERLGGNGRLVVAGFAACGFGCLLGELGGGLIELGGGLLELFGGLAVAGGCFGGFALFAGLGRLRWLCRRLARMIAPPVACGRRRRSLAGFHGFPRRVPWPARRAFRRAWRRLHRVFRWSKCGEGFGEILPGARPGLPDRRRPGLGRSGPTGRPQRSAASAAFAASSSCPAACCASSAAASAFFSAQILGCLLRRIPRLPARYWRWRCPGVRGLRRVARLPRWRSPPVLWRVALEAPRRPPPGSWRDLLERLLAGGLLAGFGGEFAGFPRLFLEAAAWACGCCWTSCLNASATRSCCCCHSPVAFLRCSRPGGRVPAVVVRVP